MVTAWFPSHLAEIIGSKFKELPEDPDFIKSWKTYQTPDGIKQYHLIMIKRGRGDDALVEIGRILKPMWIIKGYNWKIEPLYGYGLQDYFELIKK